MGALTLVIIVLGIVIVVLLAVFCWTLRRFHETTENIMEQMRVDIYALREKFCGDKLDPGKPVKHRIKPMPMPDKDSFDFNQLPPHHIPPYPHGDFSTPPPPQYPDFMAQPPPPMPDLFQPLISQKELKDVLKRKPEWSRNELLNELGIPHIPEDWRT